jgi:hypothetical protein
MSEMRAHDLLMAAYEAGEINLFDLSVERWGADSLAETKTAADLLVGLRLAKHTDEGRTQLAPTNAGRYWALNGGFLGYLRDDPAPAGRNRSSEAEALRTTYMALRLKTFWWTFWLSIAGFIISILSMVIALWSGDFPRRIH